MAALDGTGFGKGNLKDFDRLAHLKNVPMPGGSKAIKEPWCMAMVYLLEAFGSEFSQLKIDWMRRRDEIHYEGSDSKDPNWRSSNS